MRLLAYRRRHWVRLALTYLCLTVVVLILCFPFYWMLTTALKSPDQIFTKTPQWVPSRVTLQNFVYLKEHTNFPRYLINSVIVACSTTVVSVLVSTLAAYGCSRFSFHFKPLFLNGLLISQMFPMVLLVIPIFLTAASLKLLSSYLPLITIYAAFVVPFCTWMLKGYFDSLPQELEEAALVDGCTRVQALRHITLPLAAPGVAAVGLFAFIFGWQEFVIALTLLRTASMWTLSVGMSLFLGQYITLWGTLMAGGVIFTLPIVAIFFFLERYLVGGLAAGAIRG